MNTDKMIKGRLVLIIDDEPDVLETLVDLLSICKIDTAASFEEGKELLTKNPYDIAVLDIMGVKGFELVEIAKEYKIPAIMLTAYALSRDDLKRSAEKGVVYYAPKEEMKNIAVLIANVFREKENKTKFWKKMFERLGKFFYDNMFEGPEWREEEREFLERKVKQSFDFYN